jgi:hypothetical protein
MFAVNIKQLEEFMKDKLLCLCLYDEGFKKQFEHEVKDIDQFIRDTFKEIYKELDVMFYPEVEQERLNVKKDLEERKTRQKAIIECMKKPENIDLVSEFKKNIYDVSNDITQVDIILNDDDYEYSINLDFHLSE